MPTVLIVEDDPVFRRVICFTVGQCGVQVEAVGDGQAAFERLAQGGVDFLITDHQMPVCSGLELLDRILHTPGMTLPPTVLCTAKGLELDVEALRQSLGLVAVLSKPFSPRQLGALVEQHLGPALTARETEASDEAAAI